jgi:hypothetical protein
MIARHTIEMQIVPIGNILGDAIGERLADRAFTRFDGFAILIDVLLDSSKVTALSLRAVWFL